MTALAPPPTPQPEAVAGADAGAVADGSAAAFAVLAVPPARGRRGAGRFLQSIPSALEALRANKGRSVLTTLGIVIGVAAVIAIVALGQGASSQVTGRLQGLGTNVLIISPGSTQTGGVSGGAGTGSTLEAADSETIRETVAGISAISPIVQGSAQVIAGRQNWQTRIQAVRPDYQRLQNWQIAQGGFFSEQEEAQARNVAVLGKTVVSELFPDGQDPLGQLIRVRNVPFTVIGVLASKGAGFGGDQDDVILIPFRTGQVRLFGSGALSSISVQVAETDQIATVSEQVTQALRDRHGLLPSQTNDFSIRNNTEFVNTLQGVTQTLTLLLGGVAAVSLVVGGIGIMNIMLVSVTERTREIGIRMAIGARPGDIQTQFLIEALVLSLLGGLIGVAIGAAIAVGLPLLAGWSTTLSGSAVAIAFGFSALIGIFFGIYPARKASRLDPIQALRHE